MFWYVLILFHIDCAIRVDSLVCLGANLDEFTCYRKKNPGYDGNLNGIRKNGQKCNFRFIHYTSKNIHELSAAYFHHDRTGSILTIIFWIRLTWRSNIQLNELGRLSVSVNSRYEHSVIESCLDLWICIYLSIHSSSHIFNRVLQIHNSTQTKVATTE